MRLTCCCCSFIKPTVSNRDRIIAPAVNYHALAHNAIFDLCEGRGMRRMSMASSRGWSDLIGWQRPAGILVFCQCWLPPSRVSVCNRLPTQTDDISGPQNLYWPLLAKELLHKYQIRRAVNTLLRSSETLLNIPWNIDHFNLFSIIIKINYWGRIQPLGLPNFS